MPGYVIGRRDLFAAAIVLAAPTALADETDEVLASIAAARATIRTLVADFMQVRRIGLLATDVRSRGEMTLVCPDRLRWELLPPDAVTYWVGPQGLAFASGTARAKADRGAAGRLGSVMDDLMVVLGGDLRGLRQRYQVRAKRSDGRVTIEARPRAETKPVVDRLEVELARDMVTPVSMLVKESETEHVRIEFSNVRTNVPVEASKMRAPVRW